MALRTVAQPRKRRAFTLVELLVVIGIIVVLIALLLPAIGMVRASSRSSQCASRLRQAGMAINSAKEKLGAQFQIRDWQTKVQPFLQDTDGVLDCPANVPPDGSSSYGLNHRALRMGGQDAGKIVGLDYKQPLVTVVANSLAGQDDWPNTRAPRHAGYLNVLFHDGRVEAKDPNVIDPRYCEPFSTYWRPKVDEHLFTLSDCLSRPEDGTGTDTDGDGDPNTQDPDDDNDGIPDDTDPDDDNDGIPDASDPDDDNDGVPDDSDPDTDGGGTDGTTEPASGYVSGLLGEYRLGEFVFEGPATTRVDESMRYPFGGDGAMFAGAWFEGRYPDHDHPRDGAMTEERPPASDIHTIVWSGQIRGKANEEYTFYVTHDNGATITVGGTTIHDTGRHAGVYLGWFLPVNSGSTVSLNDYEWTDIVITTVNVGGPGHFRIGWKSASTPLEDIPAEYMRTPRP